MQFITWYMKEDLNRIKVVLVEHKKTNKWLAEQLDKDRQLFRNGAPTKPSQDWRHYLRLPSVLMST